jgi:hypothetical protein
MRPLLLALVLCAACAAPDPFVDTYSVNVTGMDTETAPGSGSTSVTGAGTVVVTPTKDLTGYEVTFGQATYSCTVKAKTSATAAMTLEVPAMETCVIGTVTATTTMGTLTLDKATATNVTFTVGYSYTYTDIINIKHAGTGTRTFTGQKL